MAPIGVKLSENAFQTIPGIWFFDTQKAFGDFWRHFFQESCVLEELGIFERHWQTPRQKSSPAIRLFSVYDSWRRGKSGTDRFCS